MAITDEKAHKNDVVNDFFYAVLEGQFGRLELEVQIVPEYGEMEELKGVLLHGGNLELLKIGLGLGLCLGLGVLLNGDIWSSRKQRIVILIIKHEGSGFRLEVRVMSFSWREICSIPSQQGPFN